jgi:hypothetical protein
MSYLFHDSKYKDNQEVNRDHMIALIRREYERLHNPKVLEAFDGVDVADLVNLLPRLRSAPTPSEPALKTTENRKTTPRRRGDGRAIKTGEGYFVKTPIDAIMDTRLSHSDLRLLQLIMILGGQKGYCWHAEPTLAKMMIGPQQSDTGQAKQGVSLSMIEKGIRKLASSDYIEIVRADQLEARGFEHRTCGNTYIVKDKTVGP